MTLSAKTLFQSNKALTAKHGNTVSDPDFQAAASMALVVYQGQLALQPGDGATAAGNAYRLDGAREFLNVLLSLHETPRPPKPAKEGLNYST